MKVKELIKELEKYNQEMPVQLTFNGTASYDVDIVMDIEVYDKDGVSSQVAILF